MDKEKDFRDISIDDIIEPEEQVRTVIVAEGLQDLAESFKVRGVIQPLIVLKKGDKYEIIDGMRRYLAAQIAKLPAVPCIIRAADVKEVDLIKLNANSFREDVNPIDEGKFFIKLHEKHGLAYSEIARLCSRSDGYVLSRVSILTGDPSVLSALEGNQINFSQAVEVLKAADENIRFELLRVIIESGATVASLRVIRHDYESRMANQDPALADAPPAGGSYPEVKHLIGCPMCKGSYPVNQIYPISVCKTCYDGFLAGLKEAEEKEGRT